MGCGGEVQPAGAGPRKQVHGTNLLPWAAALALVALAYFPARFAPFVFDDEAAIVHNPSIRHWVWPDLLGLKLPGGVTTAGRPVLNLSFAINHAISGDSPWSYHVANVLIHLATGLLLFGLVRRLLAPVGTAADRIALGTSVIWLLHPVATEAVTYLSQRAESLLALFFVLTLYAFVRGAAAEGARRNAARAWSSLAVLACALGMATKEVMVTAPVVVLLIDRAFVSGSFRAAWQRHRFVHAELAATWMVLGALVWSTGGNRGGTVGFGVNANGLAYLLSQIIAVTRYAALAVWPHPLIFEYGLLRVTPSLGLVAPALAVAALAGAAVYGFVRFPRAGTAAVCGGLILAPTSLVPGTLQMIVEHRIYLPLAAAVALAIAGGHRLLGRRGVAPVVALAVAFAVLTFARNRVYRSETTLWADTVAKRPGNPLAHYNFGHALAGAGQPKAAIPEYEAALRLKPDYAEAHNNLGNAFAAVGRREEAVAHYEAALRLRPDYANAYYNLGCTLAELKRRDGAIDAFEHSLRLQPGSAEVHYNYATALRAAGRSDAALAEYARTAALRPTWVDPQVDQAALLAALGRRDEALAHAAATVRRAPASALAHLALAGLLSDAGRVTEARAEFETALRLAPGSVAAHYNLANLLSAAADLPDARRHYEAALQLEPGFAAAHYNLGLVLMRLHEPAAALPHFEAAVQALPRSAPLHHALAHALAAQGRRHEAIREEQAALTLDPNNADAREGLRSLLPDGE